MRASSVYKTLEVTVGERPVAPGVVAPLDRGEWVEWRVLPAALQHEVRRCGSVRPKEAWPPIVHRTQYRYHDYICPRKFIYE